MGEPKWPKMVASLYPFHGAATSPLCDKVPSAFGGFGIGKTTFEDEYGVSKAKKFSGCRACRLHLSPHCAMPHLECVAHAVPADVAPEMERASFASLTGYEQGTPEVCALVKVRGVRMSSLKGKESYPLADADDWVVSKESLVEQISGLAQLPEQKVPTNGMSILIDILNSEECTELTADGDWRNWPYLTTEAIEYLLGSEHGDTPSAFSFRHIRLFLPSLERADSQGGMWNHCRWFGLPPERDAHETQACVQTFLTKPADSRPWQRTVGEFFWRPTQLDSLPSAWYSLLCPVIDFVGLDFAITSPMLYEL